MGLLLMIRSLLIHFLHLPCLSGGAILDMIPLIIGPTIAEPNPAIGTDRKKQELECFSTFLEYAFSDTGHPKYIYWH